MIASPKRPEIDERTTKLLVGIIALSLPGTSRILSGQEIASISASYYATPTAQTVFVGSLFAIAAFLVSYNGQWRSELLLSKVAAIAALCVALFPCGCGGTAVKVSEVHGISAAVMFVILAVFCIDFFLRAWRKGHIRARCRAGIYALCGLVMVGAITTMAVYIKSNPETQLKYPRLIFWGESAGLLAFGVSWLTASHVLPFLNTRQERYSLVCYSSAAGHADLR